MKFSNCRDSLPQRRGSERARRCFFVFWREYCNRLTANYLDVRARNELTDIWTQESSQESLTRGVTQGYHHLIMAYFDEVKVSHFLFELDYSYACSTFKS